MTFKEALAIALMGLYVLFSEPTQAAPLDEYQAATIYTLVNGVTHLPLPKESPTVHTMPKATLEQRMKDIGVCPNGCPSIKAAQVESEVWLDEALDMQDVQNAAVLFHEFVHYYQWAKDGPAKNCTDWVTRELQAYHAQNEVLFKSGAHTVQTPSMPVCE